MPESYTFDQLNAIVQGQVLQHHSRQPFDTLAYDSRIIANGQHSLFFAIQSLNHDGHRHLQECFDKGVRNFLIEKKDGLQYLSTQAQAESNVLLVKNSIHAIQVLAAHHRAQFQLPMVGITGSNGKTIVKEWLYDMLRDDFNIARSPKSFNSQIGVPLSVWQLAPEHTLTLIEAGISNANEMEALERVIQPTVGIFTNIGEAHQANFGSMVEKVYEKLRLFAHCDALIYCKDYSVVKSAIDAGLAEGYFRDGIVVFDWSYREEAELWVREVKKETGHTRLNALYRGEEISLTVPFTDTASLENIIHCWALMLYLDYNMDVIQARVEKVQPVEMRLEIKAGINGCTIINDSYNSDLYALSLALDTLNQQQQHRQKTVILSDILQTGRPDEELYSQVAELCRQKGISRFIGIGPAIGRQQQQFKFLKEEAQFFSSTASFLQQLDADSFRNEAVLVKGSRPFGFEAIAQRLQQKAHITVLEINLNALVYNLNVYKSLLQPQTRVMAMVKAFSYGSGSYEIANILQYHKTDYLAVAYADEGVYLRQNGIRIPILVMNPDETAFPMMLEHRLEPEIYSLKILDQLCHTVKNYPEKKGAFPIHIKLDTGMHRLGFEEGDMDVLIARLAQNERLKVQSVFSHLASSDVPEQDDFTRAQIHGFEKMYDRLCEALGYRPLRHILNSSGIGRFPEAQFDMVRLGIGLYGIDPTHEVQSRLEEVSTLRTHISQIKHLQAGETVGYSRKGMVKRPSTIATIGIGYADGFSRALGNGRGLVLVHGKPAPVIGNVCMDMTMIDITGIPAEEGDEVIIFGKGLSIEAMAEAMHTIPYEVLTSVSQRVKRVYYKE